MYTEEFSRVPEAESDCRELELLSHSSFQNDDGGLNAYGSSDTWHTKPFQNSQLRRSDGCPFTVELRRDNPQPTPLMDETVIGHKTIAWWKEVTPLADVIEFLANRHELVGPCSWKNEDLSAAEEEKWGGFFDRRSFFLSDSAPKSVFSRVGSTDRF
ncbi:hypothetical protein AVEN_209089-1 [Araneus ventricosus]|uniref:Uncharacterized protein n=1 Tax=Araneus ventricosus TaxID=182803 RepID=A0A4Y2IHK7_ARAVE|nr:hypothetical protein AVEN_209089-1 [Araneus ventricosus]